MTTYRITDDEAAIPCGFDHDNARDAVQHWADVSGFRRSLQNAGWEPDHIALALDEAEIDLRTRRVGIGAWSSGGWTVRRIDPTDSVASEQLVAIRAGYLQQLRTLVDSLPADELTPNQRNARYELDRVLQGEPLGHVKAGAYDRIAQAAAQAGERERDLHQEVATAPEGVETSEEARRRLAFLQGRRQGLEAALDLLVGRTPADER